MRAIVLVIIVTLVLLNLLMLLLQGSLAEVNYVLQVRVQFLFVALGDRLNRVKGLLLSSSRVESIDHTTCDFFSSIACHVCSSTSNTL